MGGGGVELEQAIRGEGRKRTRGGGGFLQDKKKGGGGGFIRWFNITSLQGLTQAKKKKEGSENNTSGNLIWIYKVPTQKKQDHQSLFPGLALLLHMVRRQALVHAPFNPAQ